MIVFSGSGKPGGRDLVLPLGPLDPGKLANLSATLANIRGNGGTPLDQYLKQGADLLLTAREGQLGYGTYRLLVVTDGEADQPKLVDALVPDVLSRGVGIDVVGVAMDGQIALAKRANSYRTAGDEAALRAAVGQTFAEVSAKAGDEAAADFALVSALPDGAATQLIDALARAKAGKVGDAPPPDAPGALNVIGGGGAAPHQHRSTVQRRHKRPQRDPLHLHRHSRPAHHPDLRRRHRDPRQDAGLEVMQTVVKWLAMAVVWLVVIGGGILAWRLMVAPQRQEAADLVTAKSEFAQVLAEARTGGLLQEEPTLQADATSADYRQTTERLRRSLTSGTPFRANLLPVRLALDAFSGYAPLRSDEFRNDLALAGIELTLADDAADYDKRLATLASGETPVAVFTADAILKASAKLGTSPATIVLVIDETVGADAMVAYETAAADLDALNDPATRIVLTPDSPSETLARVVLANFALPKLRNDPFEPADGAADVLAKLKATSPTEKKAFVLWEPFLSKALEDERVRVLIDSGDFRGYVVDVLVMQRAWLLDHKDAAADVARAFLRASYRMRRQGAAAMVKADAAKSGEPVTDAQAERMAAGIDWKGTQANFAAFGLLGDDAPASLKESPPMPRILRGLVDVLTRTGGLDRDPTDERPEIFYDDKLLARLLREGFHPGVQRGEDETIADAAEVQALSPVDWQRLQPVGTLQVGRLTFGRGSDAITGVSAASLDALAATLGRFPPYYLTVVGNALDLSNPADAALAQQRADAAVAYLAKGGVDPRRLRATVAQGDAAGATVATFKVGQLPY